MTEWISVKDRLPEEGQRVLVCDKEKDLMTGFYTTFDNGRWYDHTDTSQIYVTHWKYLDEPPNE